MQGNNVICNVRKVEVLLCCSRYFYRTRVTGYGIVLVLGILIGGCVSTPSWSLLEPASDGGRVLRSIAWKMSRERFRDSESQQSYVAGFEVFFLRTLTEQQSISPSASWVDMKHPYYVGARDGDSLARHRLKSPDDSAIPDLVSFGYTWTNVTGVVFLASETAVVTLNDSDTWWLVDEGLIRGIEWEEKRYSSEIGDIELTSKRRVVINGYVSPVGGYGHMGRWKRQIIVKEAREEK